VSTRSDDLGQSDPAEVASTGDGGASASPAPAKRSLPVWQEMLLLLFIALGLAILIKTFFVQAFYIPSDSMDDTLVKNDRILVEKVSYWTGDVQRGDVVVFDDPGNWLDASEVQHPSNPFTRALETFGLYPSGGHLVKRVIGIGGDHVKCCDKQGRVTVNGVPLNEKSYLAPGVSASDQEFNAHVPPDHLWVMGDNRAFSFDSRGHDTPATPNGGFVPADDVVGKVFVVVWPLDHATVLSRPDTFDRPVLQAAAAVAEPAMPYLFGAMLAPPLLWLARRRRR
jgi:signal peptidase I